MAPNGAVSGYLTDLETSSFIHRDHAYSPRTGKRLKQSRYRLKDNYLRFSLKYIGPVRKKITHAGMLLGGAVCLLATLAALVRRVRGAETSRPIRWLQGAGVVLVLVMCAAAAVDFINSAGNFG